MAVKPCLAAFCLRQNFGVFFPRSQGYASIPFSPRAKIRRNFTSRGEILSRGKSENRLTLRLRSFTDRAHIVKPNAHRTIRAHRSVCESLGQAFCGCDPRRWIADHSPKGEVFTRSVFKVWIKPFQRLAGCGAAPRVSPVALRRGRKLLYGIFFLLIIF